MSRSERREVAHQIMIAAPADAVYGLIADIRQWPRIFPPTIHVEQLDSSDGSERIRIWATAGDDVKNWISRRELAPEKLRIEFRQEVSAAPIAAMGGTWLVAPTADGRSIVRLLHDYQADSPENLAWIEETVDRNSRAELAALRTQVESARASDELYFSFEDTVYADGTAEDVYDFLNEAQLWPERLPHVARVQLTEDASGVQSLAMDTHSPHGATHTTKSYRVCFPHHGIAYKQVTLPALLAVHTGYWAMVPQGSGVAVSSQHTVVLNADNIVLVLGAEATVAEAREYVRDALSTNSRSTLEHAKRYAEAARGRTTRDPEAGPTLSNYEAVYRGETPFGDRAPWDIPEPQPACVDLYVAGEIRGEVLDAGCGTGENAVFLAGEGYSVTGVDVSATAIESARRKAAERDIKVTLEVADALVLAGYEGRFDTVVDTGLAHLFDREDLVRYAAALHRATRPGATVFVLALTEEATALIAGFLGDGPTQAVDQDGGDLRSALAQLPQKTADEIRAGFADGWVVESLADATFSANTPSSDDFVLFPARLARIKRTQLAPRAES